MQRARIVAGAKNKLSVLRDKMQDYKDDYHILVYCGATRVPTFEHDQALQNRISQHMVCFLQGVKPCHVFVYIL